jgi:hypothetical protein
MTTKVLLAVLVMIISLVSCKTESMKPRPSPNAGMPCIVCGGYIVEERFPPGLGIEGILGGILGGIVRPSKPTTVVVFYATDRNRTQSTNPGEFYGTQRSEVT